MYYDLRSKIQKIFLAQYFKFQCSLCYHISCCSCIWLTGYVAAVTQTVANMKMAEK
jgi:hypothetical protein